MYTIMPTTMAGGVRRLIFTRNVNTNFVNKYVPGAGVGGQSIAVRRVKKRRATAGAGTMSKPCGSRPCCPEIVSNPSNLAFPPSS